MLLDTSADKNREVAAGFGYREVTGDLGTSRLHWVLGHNSLGVGGLKSGHSDRGYILGLCWAGEHRKSSK